MKIEEQVLSREQMAHLVELGVDTSDASMCWAGNDVVPNNGMSLDLGYEGIPTYTIGDLIEKLPKSIEWGRSRNIYCLDIDYSSMVIGYCCFNGMTLDSSLTGVGFTNIKLIDALYKLLCKLIEDYKELIK